MVFENLAQDAVIILTLLALEAVLSFDNAAVLAAMVRKLPIQDRRKALLYGLVGAYALRITAILLASFLIRTPILKVIGGGYLILLGVKHFINVARHKEHHHAPQNLSGGFLLKWGLPALVAVIIQIELVDLAFAVDQVVVAVAFTTKIQLIIIASMVGILFLRLAAAYIARVMDWLPLLEHMAYVAVTYVGVKLVFLHPYFVTGAVVHGTEVTGGDCKVPFIPVQHQVAQGAAPGCEVPTMVSVVITLSLFLVPVIIKLLFNWPRSHPGDHIAIAHPVTGGESAASVANLKQAGAEVQSGKVEQPPAQPPL